MRTLYTLAALVCGVAYAVTIGYLVPNGYVPDATLQIHPKISIGYDLLLGLAAGYLACLVCTFIRRRRLNFGGVIGVALFTLFIYLSSDVVPEGSIGVVLAVLSGYLFEKIFLKPLPSPSSSSN